MDYETIKRTECGYNLLSLWLVTKLHSRIRYEFKNCSFPLYKFEDETAYTSWSLIANKHVFTENVTEGGSNLFLEETKISYLIPEKKKVDYFIKITGLKDDVESGIDIADKIPTEIKYNLVKNYSKPIKNLIFQEYNNKILSN